MKILSAKNDRIRLVQKLSRRRIRYREGLFVIEGPRLLGEAVASHARMQSVFWSPELFSEETWAGLLPALPSDIPLYEVPAGVFRQMAATESPQGILAVVGMPAWNWEDCLAPRPEAPLPLAVLVDGLQDPGNLGTILRAAEALGATGVLLGEGSADIFNPKAVRATMGAIFRFPVAWGLDLPALVPALKERGLRVLVSGARASEPVYREDWRRPVAVVLGNEGAGVSPALLALADGHVRVPMPGRAESLNAAMAAGIVLYEALRQRQEGVVSHGAGAS